MHDAQDLHEPPVARGLMLKAFAAAPKLVGYPPMQWGDAGGDVGGDGLATRRVTMREAADLLGVSKEAIRKRVVRGTLPSEMGEDGRRYVYVEAGRDLAAAEAPTHEHDVHERDVLMAEMVEELHEELGYLREQLNQELERRSAEAKSFQLTIRELTSANASLTERLRALERPQRTTSVNQEVTTTHGAGDDSKRIRLEAGWSTFAVPSVEWLVFVAPLGPSVAAILFEVSFWGPALVQHWFYAATVFALLPIVFGFIYGRYHAKSSTIRRAIREREIEAARRSRASAMPIEVPPDEVRAALASGFIVAIVTVGLSSGGDFLVRYLNGLADVTSLIVLGSMASAVLAAMLWIFSALFGIGLERQRTRRRSGEPTRNLFEG